MKERELGIAAGYAWRDAADVIVFYVDRGWSDGMRRALFRATAEYRIVEKRRLDVV